MTKNVDVGTPAPRTRGGQGSAKVSLLLGIYVGLVILVGLVVVTLRIPRFSLPDPWLFLALLVGSIVISISKVHLPLARGSATLSMSYFTDFVTLVLMGQDAAMLVGCASGATQCLVGTRNRASLRQTLFSVSALAITIQVSGFAASWAGGFSSDASLSHLSRSTVAAAATFFLCNSWLVAVAVALSRRDPLIRTWNENFLWTAPACFIGAGVAMVAARVVMTMQIWIVLLVAAPLYVTYRSYRIYLGRVEDHQRHLQEVSDLHLASVESLARAIDARDQTIDRSSSPNDNHIRRVQAMAAALAHDAGMPHNEVEGVKVAALLHDIGKLAVPEHILTKPGRLTPDEFDRVRTHPVIGAEIIRAVPFPYPVAPYIHSHHERWDGSGYPDGLKGEAIPLGARVLAVVDYFDALTTDRPYHRAMGHDEAVEVVRGEAGRALDPTLVPRFIRLLPTLDLQEAHRLESGSRAVSRTSGPVTGFSSETQAGAPVPNVFENISRATQEIHAFYDIAQTLGTRLSVNDSMALLTSKLNPMVPASCWALFLYESDTQLMRCRFASGLDTDRVEGLTIPLGAGATGWAALHQTCAVNARAQADFEAAGKADAGHRFQAALAYPLVDAGELVGTLTLYHIDANPYRDDHRRMLNRVCNQVASVIRNSVLFEKMQQVSLTDSLTDLPNSRALFAHLHDQFAGPAGGDRSNALLMIDLDGFKAINDKHGHQVGDLILRQVAAAIRQNIRRSDFCARYAGDEFVVVLSRCKRDEANARALQIQSAIDDMITEARPGLLLRTAISIGVAVSPEDGESYEELLASADRGMYDDKQRRSLAAGTNPSANPPVPLIRSA